MASRTFAGRNAYYDEMLGKDSYEHAEGLAKYYYERKPSQEDVENMRANMMEVKIGKQILNEYNVEWNGRPEKMYTDAFSDYYQKTGKTPFWETSNKNKTTNTSATKKKVGGRRRRR